MRAAIGFVLLCMALAAGILQLHAEGARTAHTMRDALLGPYEGPSWPPFLGRLDLPVGHDYALLVLLPSAYPIDLTDAETARRTLFLAAATPSSVATSKTPIGHAMVGWRCGDRHGLISKTGETSGQGTRMILAGGWGVTALLSTFTDGSLMTIDAIPGRYRRQIAAGRANILAVEVSRGDCERLRGHVEAYMTDPAQPARRFSLLDGGNSTGDGCTSFAVDALVAAGVLRGVNFRRKVAVHEDMLGRRVEAPAGVEPYLRASDAADEKIVAFPTLRAGPWTAGKVHAVVDLLDPELVYAAVVALRKLASAPPGWREARALSDSEPAVRRVATAARRWAATSSVRARIADPAGMSVLVLDR